MVYARLEGDIKIRSARSRAGLAQRKDLGVRLPRSMMESLADDSAAAHQNSSDHRIGRDGISAALGKTERAIHPVEIDCFGH
jgi:hypothetical protein